MRATYVPRDQIALKIDVSMDISQATPDYMDMAYLVPACLRTPPLNLQSNHTLAMNSSHVVKERSLGNGLSWPYLPITLDLDSTLPEVFKKRVLPLIRPGWDSTAVQFAEITEGLSNHLLCVFEEGKSEDKLILRLYGRGTELYTERDLEAAVMMAVAGAGLSAPVACQLVNGVTYQWLPGRNLSVEEMGEERMMERVARTMARLHSIPPPSQYRERGPMLWTKLHSWLTNLERSPADSPFYSSPHFSQIGSLTTLRAEVDRLQAELRDCNSKVVLCHNDFNSLNIIYDECREHVSLIDMEFAGPNYFVFDIANHFCEFAGVHSPDFSKYPGESLQKKWITIYLEERARLMNESCVVNADTVDATYREVNKFSLASHLKWCVWALLQVLNSTINYDYTCYAATRFSEYQQRKEEFYAL